VTDDVTHLTLQQAAVHLVAILERQGATFTLDEDDNFKCDLNGMHDLGSLTPAEWSTIIFALRAEIRALLVSQRTTH
jgi:hypothetical protein